MKPSRLTAATNGVYRAPPDTAALRAAARDAGLRWTVVDLQRARGKRALLAAFARALAFPDTFGGNWDALADCLQDLSWLTEQGVVLAVSGVADPAAAAPGEHAVLLEILDAAAGYWRQRGRVFIVFADAGSGLPEFPAR